MSTIQEAILQLRAQLPGGVTLLAVSKTHPASYIEEAYAVGQRDFAENKVQEMTEKAEALPKDIRWHMIGHLQTNKVKYIAPYVSLIHSIDSLRLLEIVNREAQKHNRIIDCLLQVHVAEEETKFGMTEAEVYELLQSQTIATLENVKLRGVMGMATNTDDESRIRHDFARIKAIYNNCKAKYFAQSPDFDTVSMGMSGDYKLAIAEGSTMVRIGSAIFGKRYYQM